MQMRFSRPILFVVFLLALTCGRFAFFAWGISPKEDAESVTVVVEPGMRGTQIADMLEDKEVVASARGFRFYTRLVQKSTAIPAGVFDFSKDMSYADALNVLLTAKAPEVQVTIPEGYTLSQIGAAVREKIPSITEESWLRATGKDSVFEAHPFVVRAQKPDGVDLEGYLFPDTYRFFANASAEDVVKKMLETLEQQNLVLDTSHPELPTIHAMLTLASIVEREVRAPEEMANVADIFLKRLSIGMPLQADSTVNYVTGGDDPSISFEETKLDSPYNTYKYPALPPGPIASPGLNALRAVQNPAANVWYYFATDDAGRVYYGSTYDEHLRNVATYVR